MGHAEFGFVRLPDAFAGGSASCRRRRTRTPPSSCAPRRRRGWRRDLAGLLGVQHGLPLAYNTDLREDKRYLFDAVDCLDAAAARSSAACSRR